VREAGSSGAWTTTFTYRFKNAKDYNGPWWDALHTADTLDSVASAVPSVASSFGNAFNCVVDGTCRTPPPSPPGAWEEIDLKLECTNGGTTHTLEWTKLLASAAGLLVSPTPKAWTCQGKGSHTVNAGCMSYNSNFMGIPDGSNTLGVDSGWQLVNSRNRGGSYEYRWGLGPGGWDVQFGIDATDGEFDCSGNAKGSWSNYFTVAVREAGSSGAWTTTFTYRFREAADDPGQLWDALHTADTLDSVAQDPAIASSLGNAFNCVIDGTCRP